MDSIEFRLPAKPPRHSRYGRNARTKLATVAMMFVSASKLIGKDPGEVLTDAIRKATHGQIGVETMDMDDLGPTEMVDASGVLAMVADALALDLADERTAEEVEEYIRKCIELYRTTAA